MTTILTQHLLVHTNGRLGLIFSQQTIEMVLVRGPMESNIRVQPRLEAEVRSLEIDSDISTEILTSDIKSQTLNADITTPNLEASVDCVGE